MSNGTVTTYALSPKGPLSDLAMGCCRTLMAAHEPCNPSEFLTRAVLARVTCDFFDVIAKNEVIERSPTGNRCDWRATVDRFDVGYTALVLAFEIYHMAIPVMCVSVHENKESLPGGVPRYRPSTKESLPTLAARATCNNDIAELPYRTDWVNEVVRCICASSLLDSDNIAAQHDRVVEIGFFTARSIEMKIQQYREVSDTVDAALKNIFKST